MKMKNKSDFLKGQGRRKSLLSGYAQLFGSPDGLKDLFLTSLSL